MRIFLRCALISIVCFLSFGSAEGTPVYPLLGGDSVGFAQGSPDFVPPSPAVKANGLDDFASVGKEDKVGITFSLDAGSISGQVMDWWCVVFRYDVSGGGIAPIGVTQIGRFPLVDMQETHVCDLTLDPGFYVCMFVLVPTAGANPEMMCYDYVVIQWRAAPGSAE